MKRAKESPDFTVDGIGYRVETMKELDDVASKARRLKGVDEVAPFKDIMLRLWSNMTDGEQRQLERRYKAYVRDFRALRAQAEKGAL